MIAVPKRQTDVLGVGMCTLDYLAVVERFPHEDERIHINQTDIQGGGLTATALVAAQRMGLLTKFAGVVGADDKGRTVLRQLEDEGVDIGLVQVDEAGETLHSFIVINPKRESRTILFHQANAPRLIDDERLWRALTEARLLFLDGTQPDMSVRLAAEARARAIPVVVDADICDESTQKVVSLADVIIASFPYARAVTGSEHAETALARLLQKGTARIVVVTAGANGSFGTTADAPSCIVRQESYRVVVTDSTGAGDVYHGAFLVGLIEGWSLREAMSFASAAAALKCRSLGGRAGIPDRGTVMRFLDEGPEVNQNAT